MAITWRRRAANVIEYLSGNHVIAPRDLPALPERLHLARMFAHYRVDCVFDVGANDGQYAAFLRQSVGYTGHIISYEPIPELARGIAARAVEQGDKHWHVESLAVDSEAGPGTFHIAQSDQFSSLRHADPNQPARFTQDNSVAREVTVMRTTMATELARWQATLGFRRPYLKMDTQGNDMAVVAGAGPGLSQFVGLQTEMAIHRLYEGAPDFAEALAILRARGFEPSAFVPNNEGHFPALYEIDCILYNRDFVAA